ncbi:MAG: hypothetical protein OXI01_07965 [Albidovulum sp.]|nr:hypothetical protein [Albidovulum sp.]
MTPLHVEIQALAGIEKLSPPFCVGDFAPPAFSAKVTIEFVAAISILCGGLTVVFNHHILAMARALMKVPMADQTINSF